MTRARALKHQIRTRAARTGERYTTARRHVLSELSKTQPAQTSVPALSIRGGLSDSKSIEKTGHGLAHWFAVLDRFGAVDKGHTRAADHLHSVHGVPNWYCQGITVAYERARGLRGLNQRSDGSYEVTVTKMMAATPAQIVKAIKAQRWTDGVDADLLKALSAALEDKAAKGFVIRPDGQARFRYKWNGTTVQFNLYPKGVAKTSFVVSNSQLRTAESVDTHRGKWKAAISAIAGELA